jgi:hypothetical protein
MSDIDSINHVGMVVRDLADTTARYEAMGFQLTPFSAHAGAWRPGEPVQALGSGNRCVMFNGNYLEILANADAAAPSPRLAGYLRHHEGAHIVCFGSEHLEALDGRLRAAGIATSGVIPLQRDVDTEHGTRTAKFQRVQFAPGDSPEGYIQAARHLTPEFVYQPRYVRHPNGCTALSNVFLIVDDMDGFVERYTRYIGTAPAHEGGVAAFRLPHGNRLTLLRPAKALELLPETLHPPVPGIAAVAFRCPDLAAQRERLRRSAIYACSAGPRLVVPAEHASGVALIFEEEP